jgi:hypothetical protein
VGKPAAFLFGYGACAVNGSFRIRFSNSPDRHCEERSDEAIHSFFVPPHGLLRFARNDGKTRVLDLAAHIARVLLEIFALENRGRREDRVRAAPAVSRAICTNKSAHEHTGSAETLRPSLRNGFTAYIVLSPVSRSSLATVIPEQR